MIAYISHLLLLIFVFHIFIFRMFSSYMSACRMLFYWRKFRINCLIILTFYGALMLKL